MSSPQFILDKYRGDIFFGHSAVAIKHNWYDEINRFLSVVADDHRAAAKGCPGKIYMHVISGLNKVCEPNRCIRESFG